MPHISKKSRKVLSNKDLSILYQSFIDSFDQFKRRGSTERFFWEFLTRTEKIMFAKRLAIIVMLQRGISPYRIYLTLDVSPSTVERLGKRLDRGGYIHIASLFKEKDNKFWEVLEDLIDIITPPPYHVSKEKFLEYKRRKK